jgi:DNA primase
MSKLAPTSIKYIVKAHIKAKGVVEKPDIIGAVFGQTEGLLGSDLDLRELQRTGRIGRIEVKISSNNGNSEGEIIIPSSLDSAETALIAATMETIERIGPCTAKIKLLSVEDTRSEKRRYVVEKAKEILKDLMDQGVPDSTEISEQIKEAVRTGEITNYQGMPCGPNVFDSDDIIVVEGRADVLNLLKYGIRNTIAIEGTSIPPAIIDITKQKVVTVFTDGDRGGKLITKELMQMAEIDYVAHAPEGKEVEELTKKEAYKALRDKVPADQTKPEKGKPKVAPKPKVVKQEKKEMDLDELEGQVERRDYNRRDHRDKHSSRDRYDSRDRRDSRPQRPARLGAKQKEEFKKTIDELVGSRAACIFNEKGELLGKVPVTELENTIKGLDNPHTIIFDGKVDYKIGNVAKMKGVKILIGMDKENFNSPINILCRKDLE